MPMPPRLSDCYARHRRMFPTRELKDYKKAMDDYWKEHQSLVRAARKELTGPLLQDFIRVDRYFIFRPSQIFKTEGGVKAMDVTNRVKPFDDALADMLQIDDRYFSTGVAEKIEGLESDVPSVTVALRKVELRREQDLVRLDGAGVPRTVEAARAMEMVWSL